MEQAARLLEGVHNFCAMHSQSEHANKFNHDILAKKRRKITGNEKEEERERDTNNDPICAICMYSIKTQ